MGGVREGGRVDGPGGPKVLRVLKFDSGFAAEGCGIAFGHAYGVRVQRVHKVQRVQRGWYRRFAAMGFMLWRSCIGPPSQPKLALSLPIKGPSFCRLTVFGGSAAFGSENQTPAPAARWKCTPLGAIAPLPPEGEVLAALCLEMLMSSKAEWRANLPLRGRRRRRRQKGFISIARQGGWLVFFRAKPGCMVFS